MLFEKQHLIAASNAKKFRVIIFFAQW